MEKTTGRVVVKRHIDGGVETVEGPLPIVITVNGSAAPCRPRNAKLVQKYKRALGAQEKACLLYTSSFVMKSLSSNPANAERTELGDTNP